MRIAHRNAAHDRPLGTAPVHRKLATGWRERWVLFCLCGCSALPGLLAQPDQARYERALTALVAMATGEAPYDFARGVYLVEDAYLRGAVDSTAFSAELDRIAAACGKMVRDAGFAEEPTAPHWATFVYITEPRPANGQSAYQYDFDDFLGSEDLVNRFVTRLLRDHRGNCVSLPLLYRLVAERLGVEVHLALGPRHLWIRHRDDQGRWVNLELTSGTFPSDGHLIAELGVTAEAVRSGAYVRSLAKPEEMAYLMSLLSEGYERQAGAYDRFTDRCAAEALQLFPTFVSALMARANAIAQRGMALKTATDANDVEALRTLGDEWLSISREIEALTGPMQLSDARYTEWVRGLRRGGSAE